MRFKAVLAAAAIATGVLAFPGAASAADGRVLYVSPTGSDTAAGTVSAPWKSVAKGIKSLRAGDTLYLRGGTYAERVGGSGSGGFLSVSPGTSTARVKVAAYPGERPVISGLLWVQNMDYWTFDGVNVTWSDRNSTSEHMVRFKDGRGWVFENAEVWGAKSYANVNVLTGKAGLPADWAIRNSCIHDNIGDPSHGTAKDQLLYVNTGATAGAGTIERNIMFNAPRGKGVKLAGPTAGTGSNNVTVRYNTIYNTYKPSITVGWATKNSSIYRNIVAKTQDMGLIRGHQLDGTGNWAQDNLGFQGPKVVVSDKGYASVIADKGGNTFADPQFTSLGCNGFKPANPAAAGYGKYAG